MIQISDNFIYDTVKHRYILTEQGTINLRGINVQSELKLIDSIATLAALDKISRDIYRYLYTRNKTVVPGRFNYKQNLEYKIFLNNRDEVETIIEAMLDQLEYTAQSGGDLMANEFEHSDTILTTEQRLELLLSPGSKLTLMAGDLSQGYRLRLNLTDEKYRNGY